MRSAGRDLVSPTPPRLIAIDTERCNRVEDAAALEWLVTDARGGYACGTVANVPTRRYHGLLEVATDPPAGRTLLVHSVHERVQPRGG